MKWNDKVDSGTDHPSERSSHLPCPSWEPNSFWPCGSLKRKGLQPFFGFGCWQYREQSESVESQAAVSGIPRAHQVLGIVLFQEIQRNSKCHRRQRNRYWEMLCRERAPQGHCCHHSQYQGTLVEKEKPKADLFVKFNIVSRLVEFHFLIMNFSFVWEQCNVLGSGPVILRSVH